MTTVRTTLCVLAAAGFVLGTAPSTFGADEGAKVFGESCTGCHSADQVKEKLKGKQPSKTEWNQIIDKMIGMGADVPKKKIPALVDYLSQTYGSSDAAGSGQAPTGSR